MHQRTRQAVLLKRDGVLLHRTTTNGSVPWNESSSIPLALEALRLFAENKFTVIVFSEEGCPADARLTKHELDRLTRRMLLEIALAGGKVESVYFRPQNAREHPFCRELFPGLLLRTITEAKLIPAQTCFISDCECDVEAAEHSGCYGILLRRNNFFTGNTRGEDSREVASNLYEVAERLIRRNIPRFADVLQLKNDLPIQSLLPVLPTACSREKDLV